MREAWLLLPEKRAGDLQHCDKCFSVGKINVMTINEASGTLTESEQQSPNANLLVAGSAKSYLARVSVTGHHFLHTHLQNCWQNDFIALCAKAAEWLSEEAFFSPPFQLQSEFSSLKPTSHSKSKCVLALLVLHFEIELLQSLTLQQGEEKSGMGISVFTVKHQAETELSDFTNSWIYL